VCGFCLIIRVEVCLKASSERSSNSWKFESRCHAAAIRTSRPGLCKGRLFHPTSLYQWREGLKCQRCDPSPKSTTCDCRWCCTWLLKARCNASATSASATSSVTADAHPDASHVGLPHLRWMFYPAETASVLWLRGNNTANYRGCVK